MKTLKDLIHNFRNSNKVAIIDRKEYRKFTYTYKELYNLSRKFACYLRANNVKKGDKIIVWNYNGIEYAVILLGAILEGVIVVPIDMRSNVNFVKKIQKKVNAKIIFQTRYKSSTKHKTVFTEQLLDILEDTKITHDGTIIKPGDIVEIIYTSGTTGEPKGVILTNKNFISNIIALNNLEKIKPKFKFLSVLPLSHVFEQTIGFFIPMLNKSKIVYLKALKISALFEAFQEEKITNVVIVPRLLQLMYSGIMQKVKEKNKEKQFELILKVAKKLPIKSRKLLFAKLHKRFGKHINYFMCGGATLDRELEEFYNAIGIPILQGYGLTETSPVLTVNRLRKRKIGSVGKPIPNVEIKIDDSKEILAKGDSITPGYYKNTQKTKELFKEGWMKTGDLGELDEEGFLYLKGREKDLIVTSAGVNIYPEDLEGILNKKKRVKDSCVIGLDTKTGEEIHAVLLLKKGANAKKIIAEANKQLDSSQQITDYSVWPYEDFPRTTTLKIKKFEVKEFVQKKAKPKISEKKNKVYGILSRLTQKKITPNSDLKGLGLSSIDRIELVSLLEQELNMEIEEENLVPETKVKDLEKIVKTQKHIKRDLKFKKWTLTTPIRIIRFVFGYLFWYPFAWIYGRPSVEGRKNLRKLKGPVIFASNHQSHYDTPYILMALPLRFNQKMACASWQEFFFKANMKFKSFKKQIIFYLLTIFFNIYPFPQKKGFRKSIFYTGDLLDKKWNILIYPEGQRIRTGKIEKFKQGIGILAVEMNVPIVPIRIEGIDKILPIDQKWPSFGKAKIKIGKPIIVKDMSYIEATNVIEKAIRSL